MFNSDLIQIHVYVILLTSNIGFVTVTFCHHSFRDHDIFEMFAFLVDEDDDEC